MIWIKYFSCLLWCSFSHLFLFQLCAITFLLSSIIFTKAFWFIENYLVSVSISGGWRKLWLRTWYFSVLMISLRLVSPKYAAWPEILEIQEALMLEFMPQVWQSRKIQYCSLSSKNVWWRSFFLLEEGHPSLLWFDEVHFANKGLSSQSYGFLSRHVQMWELNHKEV